MAAKHLPHAFHFNSVFLYVILRCVLTQRTTTIYFNSFSAPENKSLKCIGENVILWYLNVCSRIYTTSTDCPPIRHRQAGMNDRTHAITKAPHLQTVHLSRQEWNANDLWQHLVCCCLCAYHNLAKLPGYNVWLRRYNNLRSHTQNFIIPS